MKKKAHVSSSFRRDVSVFHHARGFLFAVCLHARPHPLFYLLFDPIIFTSLRAKLGKYPLKPAASISALSYRSHEGILSSAIRGTLDRRYEIMISAFGELVEENRQPRGRNAS